MVVAPANVNDAKLLRQTLEALVVERPKPTAAEPQNLCLDRAYDDHASEATAREYGYQPHIRRKGEVSPSKRKRTYPPRRWVVERTFAWLSKCRAILVRYEKRSAHYLGLVQLACALLWYRRLARQIAKNGF